MDKSGNPNIKIDSKKYYGFEKDLQLDKKNEGNPKNNPKNLPGLI